VDGFIYGLVGGVSMFLGLSDFALFSSNYPSVLLERFSTDDSTPPLQGLLNHLVVAAIYVVLFFTMIWLILRRFSPAKVTGWYGGSGYVLLLFVLAQNAIFPNPNLPLAEFPLW
jgi:hypothetical protein